MNNKFRLGWKIKTRDFFFFFLGRYDANWNCSWVRVQFMHLLRSCVYFAYVHTWWGFFLVVKVNLTWQTSVWRSGLSHDKPFNIPVLIKLDALSTLLLSSHYSSILFFFFFCSLVDCYFLIMEFVVVHASGS